MMADVPGHSLWNEPLVGRLFGDFYYMQYGDHRNKPFILGPQMRDIWLPHVRAMVLEGAGARYPRVRRSGYLVIKEPHGAQGAPILSAALPESRFVFLVRDPRDSVASALDGKKATSWTSHSVIKRRVGIKESERLADTDPDEFVRLRAESLVIDLQRVAQAFDAHEGPKVQVRYEDLRVDALGELARIYSTLGMTVHEPELKRVVQAHDWESIPAEQKGPGKKLRKASPGAWREDLTEDQVRIVEEQAAPILESYYSGAGSNGRAAGQRLVELAAKSQLRDLGAIRRMEDL
jgi:sulfotransferase family protein